MKKSNEWQARLFVAIALAYSSSSCFAQEIKCKKLLAGGVAFTRLVPGGSNAGDVIYYKGTDDEREAHAQGMCEAGYNGVRKLIERHETEIPTGSAVLEIGPFLRPLGRLVVKKHPWIAWEYDSKAAQKVADSHDASVFRVDLNQLGRGGWTQFLDANHELYPASGLGAAIMSSVLNYVDYKLVLRKLINEMTDGGLLFVGNSNVGDKAMMRGRRAPNGSQILEFLMLNFPGQVEFLPGTRLTLDSMDGSRSGITVAARIHKTPQPRDLYLEGLSIYTEYADIPFEAKYADEYAETYPIFREYQRYWNSTDPAIVGPATKEALDRQYWKEPPKLRNRLAEMSAEYQRNEITKQQVLTLDKGTIEFDRLFKELREPTRERFMPQRGILAEAMEIPANRRAEFVSRQMARLYRRLGHTPSAKP